MAASVINFSRNTQYAHTIYLDANFLCFIRDRLSSKYPTAAIILGDLIVQNVQFFVSSLAIDELWWALIRGWHKMLTGVKLNQQMVKNDPTLLPRYSDLIQRNTNKTLNIPNLTVLPQRQSPTAIVNQAKNIYVSEGMMPRDCFHLAYVVTHRIEGIITADSDFDGLNLPDYNLNVYKY